MTLNEWQIKRVQEIRFCIERNCVSLFDWYLCWYHSLVWAKRLCEVIFGKFRRSFAIVYSSYNCQLVCFIHTFECVTHQSVQRKCDETLDAASTNVLRIRKLIQFVRNSFGMNHKMSQFLLLVQPNEIPKVVLEACSSLVELSARSFTHIIWTQEVLFRIRVRIALDMVKRKIRIEFIWIALWMIQKCMHQKPNEKENRSGRRRNK